VLRVLTEELPQDTIQYNKRIESYFVTDSNIVIIKFTDGTEGKCNSITTLWNVLQNH
jgi:hypothetical protein